MPVFGPLLAAESPTSAAATAVETTTKLQYDLPDTFEQWLLLFVIAGLLLAYVVWMYVRDTRSMSPVWTIWLLLLRTAVLVGLAIVYFNPHNRTDEFSRRRSQVAVVLDRSLSMRFPAVNLSEGTASPTGNRPSRTDAVVNLLAETTLLDELAQKHQVRFYTFSRQLENGPAPLDVQADAQTPPADGSNPGDTPQNDRPEIKRVGQTDTPEALEARQQLWREVITPRDIDQDTRLGESLIELLREFSSKTVSGIVIVTDGVSNAGVGIGSALDAARTAGGIKFYTVGVGSTDPQRNLMVSSVESPTLVHTKDSFELAAYVQGQNFKDEDVRVVLKAQRLEGAQDSPLEEVATQTVTLTEDGVPVKVVFERKHDDPQTIRYVVEAQPIQTIPELKADDNLKDATVTVSEKRTRVLIVAGGPTRDYRFLTGMLSRHKGVKVDALLQSVELDTIESVSQNVHTLRSDFPSTMEELNGDPARDDDETGYDVLVFFDPDWKTLAAMQPDAIPLLTRWVSEFSGGVIFVAGDVYTPDLATAGDDLKPVRTLMPVYLSPNLFFDLDLSGSSEQAWPVGLTEAGRTTGFLQVADTPQESLDLWLKEFEGFFRTYPTAGEKTGATVYAQFTDSRMADEHGPPILLAGQIYGSGRTMYLGSGETWRLRELSVDAHERFWTKLIREVGQGRRSRGSSPVTLLPEKKEVMLGETVVVRAIILENRSGDLKPSEAESVPLHLFGPNGEEIFPEPVLYRSENRAGEFVGDFRATQPGRYRLRLPIPGTEDKYREETIDVSFPGLEDVNPQRNIRLLTELARQSGGETMDITEAPAKLPGLLVDKSMTVPRTQQIQTLWDRQWVLYLLVGLLSLEWLSRKLLRLA